MRDRELWPNITSKESDDWMLEHGYITKEEHERRAWTRIFYAQQRRRSLTPIY